MATIGEILETKFPDKNHGRDFIVQDDGTGPYIAKWDQGAMGVPKPNAQQLAAWEQSVNAKIQRRNEKRDKRRSYGSQSPVVTPANMRQIVQDLVDMLESD